MKHILIVCKHSNIDTPLRRSLAHLVKSCEIQIVPNGHQAFDELNQKAFDLIIIDSEITGIDSLELAESIEFIDRGIPIILMLPQAHKPLWEPARRLNVNPILRPFKPLTFLRLVDKLLHRQLERYRNLSETLKSILENLRLQTKAHSAILIDGSGQALVFNGKVEDDLAASLGNLVTTEAVGNGLVREQDAQQETLVAQNTSEKDHDLYLTPVIENLYLALVSSITITHLTPNDIWQQIDTAAQGVKQAFYKNALADRQSSSGKTNGLNSNEKADRIHILVPLKLDADATPRQGEEDAVTTLELNADATPAQDEEYEIAINWQILSNSTTVLNRLHDFCQVN